MMYFHREMLIVAMPMAPPRIVISYTRKNILFVFLKSQLGRLSKYLPRMPALELLT